MCSEVTRLHVSNIDVNNFKKQVGKIGVSVLVLTAATASTPVCMRIYILF